MVATKVNVGVLGCTRKRFRLRAGTALGDISALLRGSVEITDWSSLAYDSTRYLAAVADEVKVGAL